MNLKSTSWLPLVAVALILNTAPSRAEESKVGDDVRGSFRGAIVRALRQPVDRQVVEPR
jgi:hypothetical protein